jgi:hypothetical protein
VHAATGSPLRDAGPRHGAGWAPWTIVALVVAGLGTAIWFVVGDSSSPDPSDSSERTVAHQRALSELSGCLLTEAAGVSRKPASDVWAGLQAAAGDAKARATFLPLSTAGSPQDQVNGLLAQRCTVIVAVGRGPADAVRSAAADKPAGVRFAAAGGDSPGPDVEMFEATREGAQSVTAALFAEVIDEHQ